VEKVWREVEGVANTVRVAHAPCASEPLLPGNWEVVTDQVRDLKPQNVLLGKFGETLVVDWGLARVVGRPEDVKAGPTVEGTLVPQSGSGGETQMGSAVGTPAKTSPEQAAGRWDVIDHATDVYGLARSCTRC
jgi:serine/threonine protein kinase